MNEAAGHTGSARTWEGPHVTETTSTTTPAATEAPDSSATGGAKRRAGGLSGMLLPELKQMAGGLGIKGVGGMRKSQLIDAIKAAQSGGQSGSESGANGSAASAPAASAPAGVEARPERTDEPKRVSRPDASAEGQQDRNQDRNRNRGDNRDKNDDRDGAENRGNRDENRGSRDESRGSRDDRGNREENRGTDNRGGDRTENRGTDHRGTDNRGGDRTENRGTDNRGGDRTENRGTDHRGNRDNQNSTNRGGTRTDNRGDNRNDNRSDRDDDGSRRNRRRRGRDRNDRNDRTDRTDRGNRGTRNEPDTTVLEDDVLVPAAGILDVLDNYAFVRTSGYLPGSDDVYVSLSMVRKFGLRRGDAVTGQVRQPREGDRKEKFNPMVRIDTINGADPEAAKGRVEFQKLTPLYASERLRLETESSNLIGRVIDIAAPIGKGQRGLIVSPSKAGKTMIMQSIANSITTNNPECHLMVVLVDERPEEVTDFERSVKGEVISSTFDRPASDHTAVAELAIERAKRLVELGHDVVVLLDGITRLGRAYNLAAPASGRILSGGVDSAALYPPKRFFGAARNIEDGGSLTILATALIESGSKMDEVIFEEFKGTGNMEIRLRRDFADKRIFPAIDAVQSGTRREELLMSKEELSIVWKLRRVLSGLDGQQALELLLERLKKSSSNIEFLTQVQKTTPMANNGRDKD
jgi:transcription termination factor Rho